MLSARGRCRRGGAGAEAGRGEGPCLSIGESHRSLPESCPGTVATSRHLSALCFLLCTIKNSPYPQNRKHAHGRRPEIFHGRSRSGQRLRTFLYPDRKPSPVTTSSFVLASCASLRLLVGTSPRSCRLSPDISSSMSFAQPLFRMPNPLANVCVPKQVC